MLANTCHTDVKDVECMLCMNKDVHSFRFTVTNARKGVNKSEVPAFPNKYKHGQDLQHLIMQKMMGTTKKQFFFCINKL